MGTKKPSTIKELVEVLREGKILTCWGCGNKWEWEDGDENKCPGCNKPFYNILEYQTEG